MKTCNECGAAWKPNATKCWACTCEAWVLAKTSVPQPLTEEEARWRASDRCGWVADLAIQNIPESHREYRGGFMALLLSQLPPITATVWAAEGEE